VGSCTDGFEVLTQIMNHKSVYCRALSGVQNAEGPKDTVELNVEWSR
jgi:hypothetical protein